MDHTNLQYYWHPQKINWRVAWYINFLEEFNYQLQHIPGMHDHTDALSRRLDYNDGTGDNEQVIALKEEVFKCALLMAKIDEKLRRWQKDGQDRIEDWENKYHIHKQSDGTWYRGEALVVAGDAEDHQRLLEIYHDGQMAGHLGVAKTLWLLTCDYWWLDICDIVQEYIRGCTWCQENKTNMHPNWPPLQPISPDPQARPFSTIAVDFIVKLLNSKGYDSILTVTDHDCTKAVILLPFKEEMGSLEVTRLYLERVFPFVGLPEKIISDRDTWFTSKVFKKVCELLKVQQKMASMYHPQTDGQSKKTNQHVETALRIFSNFWQDDWSNLLPIIQY